MKNNFVKIGEHRINLNHVTHITFHGTQINIYLASPGASCLVIAFNGDGAIDRYNKAANLLDQALNSWSTAGV